MITLNENYLYLTYDLEFSTTTGKNLVVVTNNTDLTDYTVSSSDPIIEYDVPNFNNDAEIITVTLNTVLADALTVGSYIFYLYINQTLPQNPPDYRTVTVEVNVIDTEVMPKPPDPPSDPDEYTLKYLIEYEDYRLEINNAEITPVVGIRGRVRHKYSERKDLLQAIVASSLDITLEADQDLTLSDLYSEKERDFTAILYKGSQKIFQGFLKPDGIWEDYVSDRWELTLDAIDGLSMLKNLSFVKDNGSFFFGKISQYECLYYALKRIGYTLPINISDDLPVYTGWAGTETILKSVLVNTERFYEDGGKVMDCESVLASILDLYNATIVQMNGEWWIYRTVDVKPVMNFKKYEAFEPGVTVVWNAGLEIGSHIDEYAVHHIGANQRKSIDASIQAFRVNYKYGTAKSIIINPELILGPGLTAEGWTIQSQGGKVVRAPKGNGLMIVGALSGQEVIRSNQSIPVFIDDKIDIITQYLRSNISLFPHKVLYKVETNTYILSPDGWVNKAANPGARVEFLFVRGDFWVSHTLNLPPILEDGYINVTIYAEVQPTFYISSVNMVPSASNIKGEFHTGERVTRLSSVTKADKTVYNGDSESNLFTGTLYKSDGTPTTTWNRIGVTEQNPLLQLLVEDTLRMRPRPMLFFEGDLYGYYPYLTLFTINNIPGEFQISRYEFNTVTNITRNSLKEFENAYLIENTDYKYTQEDDLGTATKVGIKVT